MKEFLPSQINPPHIEETENQRSMPEISMPESFITRMQELYHIHNRLKTNLDEFLRELNFDKSPIKRFLYSDKVELDCGIVFEFERYNKEEKGKEKEGYDVTLVRIETDIHFPNTPGNSHIVLVLPRRNEGVEGIAVYVEDGHQPQKVLWLPVKAEKVTKQEKLTLETIEEGIGWIKFVEKELNKKLNLQTQTTEEEELEA